MKFYFGLLESKLNEPCHEIMALFVLFTLILQTRMHSHPVALDVWFLVGPFVCFHTSCVRTAKALVAYVVSTIFSWAGSNFVCVLFAWSQNNDIRLKIFDRTIAEPRHDKTNKMAVRPAKAQISISPGWSVFARCTLILLILSCRGSAKASDNNKYPSKSKMWKNKLFKYRIYIICTKLILSKRENN